MAACNNWEINSFDFNRVYLNGELNEDENIYMQPPPSNDVEDDEYDEEDELVLKLDKSIYGLKQAR